MNKLTWLEKIGAGGLLFLLPFFAIPMAMGEMESQFDAPKKLVAFFLGNLCFSVFIGRRVSFFYGLAHMGFVSACFFSGFGTWQVYPCLYEISAIMLGLWFVELEEENRVFFLKLIAISGALCCFQAYLQTFGVTWPLRYAEGIPKNYPIAFLGQQTKFGAFAAMICALLLALEWYPLACFVGFCVLITGSSFAALALGAGVLVVLRHKIGLKFVTGTVAAGLLTLGAIFAIKPSLDMFAGNGRKEVWADTIHCAAERPWFGFGPGGFRTIFASHCESEHTYYTAGLFGQAHNDYLQVLFDGGWFGVGCLAIVLLGILAAYWQTWILDRHIREYDPSLDKDCVRCFRDKKSVHAAQGMLASIMANALGNFPWQLSPHYALGVISAAILLRELKEVGTIILIWPQPIYLLLQTLKRRFALTWEPLTTFLWRRPGNTSTAP